MRDSSVCAVMRLTPWAQSLRSVPSRLGYLWYCRKELFSVVLTSVICAADVLVSKHSLACSGNCGTAGSCCFLGCSHV